MASFIQKLRIKKWNCKILTHLKRGGITYYWSVSLSRVNRHIHTSLNSNAKKWEQVATFLVNISLSFLVRISSQYLRATLSRWLDAIYNIRNRSRWDYCKVIDNTSERRNLDLGIKDMDKIWIWYHVRKWQKIVFIPW